MDNASKKLIESVFSLPTMSFNETAVSTFVKWYAAGLDLDVTEDEAGNVIVNYSGTKKGGVTFTAHMDHPGFEVISANGKSGVVALWGRVDAKIFSGAKVLINTAEDEICGKIGKHLPKTKHHEKPCFAITAQGEIAEGDFGYFDIPAVNFKKDRIDVRAADNLASVAAILEMMTRLVSKETKVNVTGLFTRAEEAGCVGAFAAMELNSISKKDPLIVLECSSASGGGVTIGDGPVIRSGDKQSTYDPEIEAWLIQNAQKTVSKNKKFKYQRALLQGGRCEACAYIAEDYKVGGIALPLGNYHNHGPKGYAPEYISAADYLGMVELMETIASSPIEKDFLKKQIAPLWKDYKSLKKKLLDSK